MTLFVHHSPSTSCITSSNCHRIQYTAMTWRYQLCHAHYDRSLPFFCSCIAAAFSLFSMISFLDSFLLSPSRRAGILCTSMCMGIGACFLYWWTHGVHESIRVPGPRRGYGLHTFFEGGVWLCISSKICIRTLWDHGELTDSLHAWCSLIR